MLQDRNISILVKLEIVKVYGYIILYKYYLIVSIDKK